MALRDLSSSAEVPTSGGASAVLGLPTFWDSANTAHETEWEEWIYSWLPYSLSVNELFRNLTEQNSRVPAVLNNLNEQAAERKMVSVLFLSLGSAARKSLKDNFPHMSEATVSIREIKDNCEQAFQKRRNRTLDRYKIFSRKQNPKETLRQFWHTLTGLAAQCDFGDQTDSLIMDTFIQNMNNKTVQQKLCTEPTNNPEEAIRFTKAYEEEISRHKTFEGTKDVEGNR